MADNGNKICFFIFRMFCLMSCKYTAKKSYQKDINCFLSHFSQFNYDMSSAVGPVFYSNYP